MSARRYQLEDGNVYVLSEEYDALSAQNAELVKLLREGLEQNEERCFSKKWFQRVKALVIPHICSKCKRWPSFDRKFCSVAKVKQPECPTCGGHGIIRHEGTLDIVDDCPACKDCRPEGAP